MGLRTARADKGACAAAFRSVENSARRPAWKSRHDPGLADRSAFAAIFGAAAPRHRNLADVILGSAYAPTIAAYLDRYDLALRNVLVDLQHRTGAAIATDMSVADRAEMSAYYAAVAAPAVVQLSHAFVGIAPAHLPAQARDPQQKLAMNRPVRSIAGAGSPRA